MSVRDFRALEGLEVVPFDVEFDLARAVKSEAELESVRDSVRINTRGFELWAEAYAPGRTAAEVMAVAEEYFVAEGCGRLTMNMVLTAPGRSGIALPEFKIARKDEVLGDFVLPSLEVAGPGMHWVEVSRAVAAEGTPLSDDTKAMSEAYDEYFAAAGPAMKPGATCHDVHTAVSRGFLDRGYHLGHVTGHSIGMTMIEFPKVGEGVETELAENMVLSMHPHAIAANGEDCLYMQDTWLVTAEGGVALAGLPMGIVVVGVTPKRCTRGSSATRTASPAAGGQAAPTSRTGRTTTRSGACRSSTTCGSSRSSRSRGSRQGSRG